MAAVKLADKCSKKRKYFGKALGGIMKTVKLLTGIMWGAYGVLAAVMSVMASVKAGDKRNKTNAALPGLFLLLHLSYGIGTVAGILKKESR